MLCLSTSLIGYVSFMSITRSNTKEFQSECDHYRECGVMCLVACADGVSRLSLHPVSTKVSSTFLVCFSGFKNKPLRARKGGSSSPLRKPLLGIQLANREIATSRVDYPLDSLRKCLSLIHAHRSILISGNHSGHRHHRSTPFGCIPFHFRCRGLSSTNYQSFHCNRKHDPYQVV